MRGSVPPVTSAEHKYVIAALLFLALARQFKRVHRQTEGTAR
jgi:hypothetical protein